MNRSFRHFCLVVVLSISASTSVHAAKFTVQVSNPAGEAVSNAGVYAILLSGNPPVKTPREISIEQVNKEFVPLVSIAQTGALVNLPNRDPIRHHVYSFSPAKTFEIKLYSGVPSKPVMFDKPGEVVLGCNIHDNMLAYVLVVDTPYFGKSDEKGRVVLDGLPAGDYELRLWYPGGGAAPAAQKAKVGTSDTSVIKFVYSSKLIARLQPVTQANPAPIAGK